MGIIINALQGKPNAIQGLDGVPFPSIDAAPPQALIARNWQNSPGWQAYWRARRFGVNWV